jgi:hypothetical protein
VRPVLWTFTDLTFLGFRPETTDGDIVTVRIGTPAGEVQIIGALDINGRTLIVRRTHIQSDAGPNGIGIANLRTLAAFLLERIDCDEAVVEGETRTIGAAPGRRPRPLRFARRPGVASGSQRG